MGNNYSCATLAIAALPTELLPTERIRCACASRKALPLHGQSVLQSRSSIIAAHMP